MAAVILTPAQETLLYAGTPGIINPAVPGEVFSVQDNQPQYTAFGWDWLCRRVHWDCNFTSWIILWCVRWYHGASKADGSRTFWWNKYLGNPGYVIATTPKELLAFRFTFKAPDRERWDNMGGI